MKNRQQKRDEMMQESYSLYEKITLLIDTEFPDFYDMENDISELIDEYIEDWTEENFDD